MIEHGVVFGSTRYVTEADLDAAIRLTGGTHPVHTSDEAALSAGFKGRIFHGPVTAAILTAAIGAHFSHEQIAIVEQSQAYKRPVYPGDNLSSRWWVEKVTEHKGRNPSSVVLELSGELKNQHDEIVISGRAKVLVLNSQPLARDVDSSANESRNFNIDF